AEYDRFLERFLEHLEVGRVSLVMNDWGGVGLAFAQRRPELIERLVLINTVAFLPGYRWHRIARIWRTPVLGELAMGTTTRAAMPKGRLFGLADAGTWPCLDRPDMSGRVVSFLGAASG